MSVIIPRTMWVARYRNGVGTRPLGNLEVYLHHSVTKHLSRKASVSAEAAQMRFVESIGQQRFGAGISYTFGVFPSGRVFEGASVNRISYHSGGGNKATGPRQGRNTGGAGICLIGNTDANKVTPAQRDAVVWLLQEGVRQGWWRIAAITEGHRDFKGTACPGRYAYALIPHINARATSGAVAAASALNLESVAAAPPPPESPEEEMSYWLATHGGHQYIGNLVTRRRIGDPTEVEDLKVKLSRAGYTFAEDGAKLEAGRKYVITAGEVDRIGWLGVEVG